MAEIPSPSNFRITNRDTSPVRKTRMEWDAYTEEELEGEQLIGFRVYRSTTPGFVASGLFAGDGNCIADELLLDANTFVYEDGNISAYGVYYYQIRAIGRFGYGFGPYGDGSPYGGLTIV